MKLKIRFDNVNKKTWFSSIQFAKYHLQTTTGIFYKYFWFFFDPNYLIRQMFSSVVTWKSKYWIHSSTTTLFKKKIANERDSTLTCLVRAFGTHLHASSFIPKWLESKAYLSLSDRNLPVIYPGLFILEWFFTKESHSQ